MREQLGEWAAAREISLAEAIRRLIAKGLHPKDATLRKQAAARQLFNINLKDVPAPEALEEEIHRAVEGA